MQEQLPLRPAEFVKIRDGFIAFLRQPAETSLQSVISDSVRDAMASAARRGRKRRIGLHFAQLASVVVALLAVVLIAAQDRITYGGGLVLLFAAGGTFIWARKRAKARDEPEIEEILTEPDETLARNLRALEDFRKQIASGDIPCVERLPDGDLKPVTKSAWSGSAIAMARSPMGSALPRVPSRTACRSCVTACSTEKPLPAPPARFGRWRRR